MRRAFTLIELLVCLGIITVLIGILLPTLARAREAGKTVRCLSNLRQMATAAQAYVNEFHGYYPPAQWDDHGKLEWDFASENGVIVPGLLWRGHTSMAIQQCPSFDGKSNAPGDPYTGYNYNTSYIGHGYGEVISAPAKVTAVRNPTATALFGDGQWRLGANKYMRSPKPSPGEDPWTYAFNSNGNAAGAQGFRHGGLSGGGLTNVGFCDGHAESLRYDVFNKPHGELAKGTGFLSADNELYDLQ